MTFSTLPYDPTKLARETKKYYLSATPQDIEEMLEAISVPTLEGLFDHIPHSLKFAASTGTATTEKFDMGGPISYPDLVAHMEELSLKNTISTSFIGDGLQVAKVQDIVPFVSNLRGLTTAYTPYQPERSQGTLQTLWLYASTLRALTGFEAINASLYDRSTSIWEAIGTAVRLKQNKKTILVSKALYPGDWEVLTTLFKETHINLVPVPVDPLTGVTHFEQLKALLARHSDDLSAMVFSQVNGHGLIEDSHMLTDLVHAFNALVIAVIDPAHFGTEGLTPPAEFGAKGADIIIGEAQHLAIGPNFGGPGLGLFGVRYNAENKNSIRKAPGRYVGKTLDSAGNPALCMILSTREQHIRRENATSNICSNQSFLATLVGAANLSRGATGLGKWFEKIHTQAKYLASKLSALSGVKLLFPQTPFVNEFIIQIDRDLTRFMAKGMQQKLQLGIDVSKRIGHENCLKISINETHTSEHIQQLLIFFKQYFSCKDSSLGNASEHFSAQKTPSIPENFKRQTAPPLPQWTGSQLRLFFEQASQQNVSPDDNIYPLGSCTMKYNPYINDYAAGLKGFTDLHPQAPLENAQGSLEILYAIQEMFQQLTGLTAVTTQPVAGAQGELVGLKLFQAYHRDRGEHATRNIILIPKSAHGTNPASATMAGIQSKKIDGKKVGIITIDGKADGHIDMDDLKEKISNYKKQIIGVMVTNPNTSGIFETDFKEMADLIHDAGGLVYMDGANMNAIAGWANLNAMGVDAVHNNLHKTWSIPHGGGGPGDAIVAVSEKLADYLPGIQVVKEKGIFSTIIPKKSIGSVHRHYGNFAHKVRCYTYLKSLGTEGVKKMSAVAVLSARYLFEKLKDIYPTLPSGAVHTIRMHEFILTIPQEIFVKIAEHKIPKAQAIAKIGKLFLDFGLHAPTIAFPEVYGVMIEPTETFSKAELDRFALIAKTIFELLQESPEVLTTTPHFTPVRKIDEVYANKNISLFETLEDFDQLEKLPQNIIDPKALSQMSVQEIKKSILKAHYQACKKKMTFRPQREKVEVTQTQL